MRRGWQALLVGLILVAVTVPQTRAQAYQEIETDTAPLVEELASLNATLERMALMLERSLTLQDGDFLLRRIELKERRLRPMESQLRTTQNQIRDSREQVTELEQMLENFESQLREAIQAGNEQDESGARRTVQDLEGVIKIELSRIEEYDRQVIEQENGLERGRRDLEILDEQLEEFLEN